MRILISCLLLLVSFKLYAGERPSECNEYYHVGYAIMHVRQNDIPLKKLMDGTEGLIETKDLVIKMINEAYGVPVYEVKEDKEKAAMDFGNKMYLICYEM